MTEVLLQTKEKSRWKGASLDARLLHFRTIFVKHKAVNAVVTAIKEELPLRQIAGHAVGMLVIAGPGSGKSSLLKFLARAFPDEVSPTLTTRRVVIFKVPVSPSPKSMSSALLKALGDPTYDRGTLPEMLFRLGELIKRVGVTIIGLDDFQDVPSKRRARGVEAIANWIRDLCDLDFHGVVLAVGTDEADVVRDAHPQLRRRMQARFELPVFSMDTPKATGAFTSLLDLLDQSLPLAETSNLSGNFCRPLLAATGGIFDYLMKLLVKATVHAVKRGSEKIERLDLIAAFDRQHQVAAIGGNPFVDDWNGQALVAPGQIFHTLPIEEEHSSSRRQKQRAAA